MSDGARVAVVLRKEQSGVSIADEHDAARIRSYCEEVGSRYGLSLTVIVPRDRDSRLNGQQWDGVLFIGADDAALQYINRLGDRCPVFMWAKGYDLTIDPRWAPALRKLRIFFNSSYLSAVENRFSEQTRYLPTAFHDRWPRRSGGWIDALRNRLVDVQQYDLMFSGSDRHVRPDRYRQRLLNLLVARGVAVCVAAPRSVWNRRASDSAGAEEPLSPAVRILGTWGDARTFRRARIVLDLPWLDNAFPTLPAHQDPSQSVFALGWNIFRAGAYGACVLTHDCPANRALGLDPSNCLFYRSDIGNLATLADELMERMAGSSDADRALKKAKLAQLFHDRHTYRHRWSDLCGELGRFFGQDGLAAAAS